MKHHHDTKNQEGSGDFRETPISKPLEKPARQYTSNESVPADPFCEEPVDQNFENPGDLSKRFM
jgi:hypothetical protein